MRLARGASPVRRALRAYPDRGRTCCLVSANEVGNGYIAGPRFCSTDLEYPRVTHIRPRSAWCSAGAGIIGVTAPLCACPPMVMRLQIICLMATNGSPWINAASVIPSAQKFPAVVGEYPPNNRGQLRVCGWPGAQALPDVLYRHGQPAVAHAV